MSGLLAGKVAIVTGAGSGIGRAIALQLAREGAAVMVSDVDDHGGEETLGRIRAAGGRAGYRHADTSQPADHERLVAVTQDELGGLHVAVNNAGIGGATAPVGEYPIDSWDKVIAVNLSGVFYGMRYQIGSMMRSGGGDGGGGSIINITSVLGQVGFRTASAYVAAKHGVVGLTRTAALEYGPSRIRVNAVAPGFIHTPLLERNLDAQALAFIAGQHAMQRLGTSEEVAELVTWLASDRASFVTGAYYAVDGGYLAQ